MAIYTAKIRNRVLDWQLNKLLYSMKSTRKEKWNTTRV